jgi:hypothetical protein
MRNIVHTSSVKVDESANRAHDRSGGHFSCGVKGNLEAVPVGCLRRISSHRCDDLVRQFRVPWGRPRRRDNAKACAEEIRGPSSWSAASIWPLCSCPLYEMHCVCEFYPIHSIDRARDAASLTLPVNGMGAKTID